MALKIRIVKRLPEFVIDIDFSCEESKLLALIGPSGSGKTTIVRIIAGLDKPDEGEITYNGTVWVDTKKGIFLPPQKRQLGYVFQEYSLFPHLTVEENVAFAAKNDAKVEDFLQTLGVWHLRTRRIQRLSGGERQRVALAQALASDPKVLLLDEPFSALDVVTRGKLQQALKSLKGKLCLPIVHVTHDLEEAEILADKILPVEQGKLAGDWLENYLAGTPPGGARQFIDNLNHNHGRSDHNKDRCRKLKRLRRLKAIYTAA